MVQRIEVPGMGIVEFPDGMSDEEIGAAIRRNTEKPKGASLSDLPKAFIQQTRDLLGGAIRGAGSIGATLLAPMDALNSVAMNRPALESNRERRQDMTDATQSLGADPESLTYGFGKLGGEIAGTAGAGPMLAGLGRAVPGAARAAPLLDAIGTAGFRAGGATGIPGLAARTAGGAISGGASAGLVNPEDAGTGATIGALLPGGVQALGKMGHAVGGAIRGPAQSPDLMAAIKSAQDLGYVIPPTQAKPSLWNRTIEGLAGKLTTAQNASAANQGVTNKLAAKALGLAEDTKLTPELLTDIRNTAGRAYDGIGRTGTVVPGADYTKALDEITAPHLKALQGFPNAQPSPVIKLVESLRTDSFDAAAAVAKIKELRTGADDAFRTGNTDIGRAAKKAAGALEDALERHLQSVGATDALQQFRDARKLIAKTYSVEKALNPTTGTVDAQKLAGQLNRGRPLSGDLLDAANFANRFKTASRPVESMGSLPQTSPLDWALAGGLTAATSNPLGMAGLLARPAARKAALSPMVQRGLLQSPRAPWALNDDLLRFGLLAGPVLGADQ